MKLKTLKSIFLLAFGVIFLTACMNVEADLKLDSKALASGEYKATIEKSIAAMMGITDEESFKTLLTTQEGSDLSSEEISVVDSGSSYVMTAKVSDYPLADDDDMSATVMPDGRIKFVFSQEGNTDESTIGIGNISLKIEFPGDISELSPEFQKVDSRNALLVLPMSTPVSGAYVISESGETTEGDSGSEEAASSDSDGGSSSMLIILFSVLVLLIGGGIVLKRKNSTKSDLGSNEDVGEPS
jgi:hypothetical protein